MVQRRYRRRPWYRTRAYRLARTALLVVVLSTMWSRCGPAGPGRPGGHTVAAAGADSARADGRGGPGTADPASSAPPGPPPRPLPRSRPTSFRVPSLGVDAPITPLRLDGQRQLETPPVDRPRLVGWYEGGPTPGEAGTAIAVGHRDTTTGPAVFAGLAQVKPGKTVEVRRADGRTAVYSVDRVKVFDKLGFPDKEVYGATGRPELRVITCGGLFSRRTGYTSNVVVFAHLTATR
ncbi:class F sortase [Streptomyces sp. SID486]|nr:class F sortase [Streptomyces sp. SID486]MYY00225.1 class F sortase [Streptomyces sp. SID486]